jgi:hypothetical protein
LKNRITDKGALILVEAMYDSLTTYLTLALLMGNPVFAHNDYPFVTLTKQKKTSHHEHVPPSSSNTPIQMSARLSIHTKNKKTGLINYLKFKSNNEPLKVVGTATDTFSYILTVSEETRFSSTFEVREILKSPWINKISPVMVPDT